MPTVERRRESGRYSLVTKQKARGATYTPEELADFVAEQIVCAADLGTGKSTIKVLDPAVGEGELLVSLLSRLPNGPRVEVYGFDTSETALSLTESRLRSAFPKASIHLRQSDFLSFVLGQCGEVLGGGLFETQATETFDLIIANPPYVRTQIIGAKQAQELASRFGLCGRVDLYYAFVLGMAKVLKPHGIAGIIVSNRFMTTKAGASVRRRLREEFQLRHVWDLGDTKLFDAAVLPAVILAEGKNGKSAEKKVGFTSIYETQDSAEREEPRVTEALKHCGVIAVGESRRFLVHQGSLDESGSRDDVWRVATEQGDAWLATVKANTWRTFSEIGQVRVGVKTCADKVFIRSDWETVSASERPELLRPLITHHVGRPFKADLGAGRWQIVYPHERHGGKRCPAELGQYPRTRAYLEQHRAVLESRKYVLEAGRQWYEIWVPQDPAAWERPKLVFRDISERPCFWIDREGSVVNGDCYWMVATRQDEDELLWLAAAVANSGFIEAFYDHRFHNKLYAGRRRFITQYVQEFPVPDARLANSKAIIELAKEIYETVDATPVEEKSEELERLVWKGFGLGFKETAR